MRLYTLMSNELSYNVDTSIAFYVQLLMIKISKNTKIQGDFPLLVIKNSVISDETVRYIARINTFFCNFDCISYIYF